MNLPPLYKVSDIPTEPGLEMDMFRVTFGKPKGYKAHFFNWLVKTMSSSLDQCEKKPTRNWKFLCLLLPMYLYVRMFKLTINTEKRL